MCSGPPRTKTRVTFLVVNLNLLAVHANAFRLVFSDNLLDRCLP